MSGKEWIADYGSVLVHARESINELLPKLVGAIFVLILGVLIALLIRAVAKRLVKNSGRLIPNKKLQSRVDPVKMERAAIIISRVLYWIIIFFFLTTATEILGLPIVTTWFSGIAVYLPKLFVAALIMVAGVIGGMIIRDVVVSAAASAGIPYSKILGNLANYSVLLITIFIGIEQVGIDIKFLTTIILILIAGMIFGAALAFGLGAGTVVGNILASHYLQQQYRAGQRIKIGSMEGRIIHITPNAVILDSPEGELCVPARQFSENVSLLVGEG